jgi:hypothetical protein
MKSGTVVQVDDVLRYYALNNRQLYENRLGIKTEFIKIMRFR